MGLIFIFERKSVQGICSSDLTSGERISFSQKWPTVNQLVCKLLPSYVPFHFCLLTAVGNGIIISGLSEQVVPVLTESVICNLSYFVSIFHLSLSRCHFHRNFISPERGFHFFPTFSQLVTVPRDSLVNSTLKDEFSIICVLSLRPHFLTRRSIYRRIS